MKGTIINEKIAQNLQDIHLATESAESAIRVAHRTLTSPTNKTLDLGYFETNVSTGIAPNLRDWSSNFYTVAADKLDTTSSHFSSRATQPMPRYRIEKFFIPHSELDIGTSIPEEDKEVRFTKYFRVIGRGVGLDGNNEVLLESIVIEAA